jgi:hypothetical protein
MILMSLDPSRFLDEYLEKIQIRSKTAKFWNF